MPRSAHAPPSRRSDGSSENARRVSEDGAGEEKCTTVAIRLRPLNERETAGKQGRIWRCVPTHNSVTQTSPEGNPLPVGKGNTFFTYDRIFDEDSSTQEVYEGVAQEIVHSVVRGMNGTIFAYGQTSSGKTFTMQGDGENTKTPGIVQMAARDVFDLMGESQNRVFLMRVSYLEIYQEEIRDLLNPGSAQRLQVREDPRKGVYIDAHEEVVSNFSTVLNLLSAGEKQRHVGCTEMNSRSSRSHTLFRLVVESQERYVDGVHASPEDVDPAVLVATLNLVDLAGSESVRHTGATGIRQKEGGNINRSLLTLSRVIQTLSQGGNAHVNYRDSKLTRILQPSLSGNAGMAIICCATAAEGFLEETRSTFQFAARAKEIKTRATVNEVLDDKAQLRRMSQELAQLKRQHAEGGSGSALVETLQAEKAEQAAKIERLKKLLINTAPAEVDDVERHHMAVSPRYRRSKRSRETWCPGEGALALGLNLLEPNSRIATIEEEGLEHLRKRRSSAGQSTPSSKSRPSTSSPCTPHDARRVTPPTPGMTPARARAHQEVAEMRERLEALQAERDAKAAEAEAALAGMARVEQLEQEVSRRDAEVLSLKEKLEASSSSAGQSSVVGTEEVRGRVEEITAQLEEAVKAKEDLEAELTEFGEYTDMKDEEMVDVKKNMAAMEEELRQKEAELAAIRAAEEKEEADNALHVAELQGRVRQLEDAIKERDEAIDGMDVAGADSTQKEEELETLKAALSACQAELAEHVTRADGAEEELERLVQELSSTKARLAEEREAAEQAAHEASEAVLAAREAIENASRRENEAAVASREQIEALEMEREELLEQEAKLRALNDDAEAILAENEARLSSIEDGGAETALASEAAAAASSAEIEVARKAVEASQAEVAERDLALAEMQARVEGLEGGLAGAKAEQGRLDVQVREEKERADASLAEVLAGQRRAEDALSVACQSQLELRCRLADAMLEVEEAEAARADMAAATSAAKFQEGEEIAVLGARVAEVESLLEAAKSAEALASSAAEQANVAAAAAAQEADEAKQQLAAGQAADGVKDAKIAELADVIERLEADGETRSGVEQEFDVARQQMDALRAEKQEGDAAVVQAQADKEYLVAQVQELTEKLAAGVAEAEAARDELAAATAKASEADANASQEIARLREAADVSSEEVPAVQAQLEAAKAEAVSLAEAVEALEAQLLSAEVAASERVSANAARVADVEGQLKAAVESYEGRLASVQEAAVEKESADAVRIAEVEGQLKMAVETAATERDALVAARAAETESQIEAAAGSLEAQLASARAAASEREAADAARIAELKGQMEAAAESFEARLAAAETAASEKEAAHAARISEIDAQTEAAIESFEAQMAAFQSATSEEQAADAAHIVEMEAQMKAAVESFEEQLAAVGTAASERQAADATRIAEVEGQMKEAVESLEARLVAAESAASGTEAVGAARIAELEAQIETAAASFREELVVAEASASEKEAAGAARVADIETEMAGVVESLEAKLAAAHTAASEKDAADAARIAEIESEMQAATESFEARLASFQGAISERESSDSASIAEVESQMKAAAASFEEQLAAAGTAASEREAADAARIAELEGQMKEAVRSFEARLAFAESAASERTAADAARVGEVESQMKAAAESFESQLAAAATVASEREAADAARIAEIEGEMKAVADQLPEALASVEKLTSEVNDLAVKAALVEGLTAELEAAREEAASTAAARHTEEGTARAELERALASVAAKEEEIAALQELESEQVREALLGAAESAAALAQNETKIAEMKLKMEANESVENELTEALEYAESLLKEGQELTEQILEKDAKISVQESTIAELREQIEAGKAELAALQASAPSPSRSTWQAITDGLDGEAEDGSEVRRLRVELDKKGSEMDTLLKEAAAVRAELKEMKGMFNAAEAGAGAAGADEDSLRKRLSQLMCENGLLKGEKDRLEALAASAAAESKSRASRSAVEIEGLEREVGGLQERAEKASRGAAEGDRAKAAVGAMDAKLSELRQERTDLQNAAQRSLDRCSEAEAEVATLRARLAEAEERSANRGAIVALETKVDALEEEVRRAGASRVEMEGDARESLNRAKRLQGEVDMMRAEYEIVSEEASGLRGSLAGAEAKLEEAEAQAEALAASNRSSDRSEQLEADIARLLEERAELQAAQQETLRSAEQARTQLQEEHDEAVRALEAAISEAMDAVEMKEAELAELSQKRDELCAEVRRAGDEAKVAADRLAAAEGCVRELEQRLTEADEESKDTEGQLRHRLNAQVAETENLRQELVSSRDRSEQAEEAVRASEQRAKEGADKKTKGLLAEMETLCQEKLLAENKADEMEAELDRLREEVAGAEQRAARDQSMIIRASEERMTVFEEAAAAKDSALADVRAALKTARGAEKAATAAVAEVTEQANAAAAEVAELSRQIVEGKKAIAQKDSRIKRLEDVRLTNHQVEKLQAMKTSARKTAAENRELKQRLAVLEEGLTQTGGGSGSGSGSSSGAGQAAADLAAATERIAELQGAKNNLMVKLREYGKRVHELEKEHTRVRAAVEQKGVLAPEGRDLGDAVLEMAERVAGSDASMMSSFSAGEGSAIAAAAAAADAAERHHAELEEMSAALRKGEEDRSALKEQMIAGVGRFRELEAREARAREALEAAELEKMEAVNAAVKAKEKDHERQIKFLQEENVTLFQENTDVRTKADTHKAELDAIKEKLSTVKATPAPASATKKRPCADRTNVPIEAAPVGKPAAAGQPTAAAARRARSRALLESPSIVDEEGAGECTQS